jgi:hypothetical protein
MLLVAALDLAYIGAADDGVLEAIRFGQRWDWWSALGWVLFAIGAFLGLVFLGIGLARSSRRLRYPGVALAASTFVMFLIPPAAFLLAASLVWIAWDLWRNDRSPAGAGGKPQPAR